jgi:hypothetical protein
VSVAPQLLGTVICESVDVSPLGRHHIGGREIAHENSRARVIGPATAVKLRDS